MVQQVPQAVTDFGQILQPLIHLLNLAGDQFSNVRAGAAALAPDGDDPLDLIERETQASRLPKERQDSNRVRRVESVARRGSARWRENSRRFINSERLAAGAATPGNLADEQTIAVHGQSVNLTPRGQVKRYSPGAPSYKETLPQVTTSSPGFAAEPSD